MASRALAEVQVRPLINSQVLQELIDVGELEFAEELLGDFFKQAKDKLPEITGLFGEKKFQEMSRVAHYVKSSAATLGLARMQALCSELQKNSEDDDDRDDDIDESLLKGLIDKFQETADETEAAVAEFVGKLKK
eukprot:Nk52_evm48s78 gene=Nk52_evmTU48s78